MSSRTRQTTVSFTVIGCAVAAAVALLVSTPAMPKLAFVTDGSGLAEAPATVRYEHELASSAAAAYLDPRGHAELAYALGVRDAGTAASVDTIVTTSPILAADEHMTRIRNVERGALAALAGLALATLLALVLWRRDSRSPAWLAVHGLFAAGLAAEGWTIWGSSPSALVAAGLIGLQIAAWLIVAIEQRSALRLRIPEAA